MISKIRILAVCSLIVLLLGVENVKADNKTPAYDSTCCTPDSLRFISANYPVFCVSWHVPTDSLCRVPQGFDIQWKPTASTIWKNKIINYSTGGVTITFCDSTDTCGVYLWRVRTICNDSTYSDWVNGPKFTMPCPHGRNVMVQGLSISPNPASERITINSGLIKPGPVKISIVNMAGKNVYEKMITMQGEGHLKQELPVSGWQKGIYFVSIIANGVALNRASFVKE